MSTVLQYSPPYTTSRNVSEKLSVETIAGNVAKLEQSIVVYLYEHYCGSLLRRQGLREQSLQHPSRP